MIECNKARFRMPWRWNNWSQNFENAINEIVLTRRIKPDDDKFKNQIKRIKQRQTKIFEREQEI